MFDIERNEGAVIAVQQDNDLLPEERIASVEKHITLVREFVKRQMIEGVDFGTVPGVSKPFLFKPGAEKLLNLFNFTAKFTILKEEIDWERGFVYYKVKCEVYHNDEFRGEGFGSCNSFEKKFRNRSAFDLDNTVLKMAKKRALIDAVLTATRASFHFSQDEDLVEEVPEPQPRQQSKRGIKKKSNGNGNGFREKLIQAIEKKSEEIGVEKAEIFDLVAQYIREKFNKTRANELTKEEQKEILEYVRTMELVAEEEQELEEENESNESQEILEELEEAQEEIQPIDPPTKRKLNAIESLIQKLVERAKNDPERTKILEGYLRFYSNYHEDKEACDQLYKSLKALEKEWS